MKSRPRVGPQLVADGFEGTELHVVSTRKPRRRVKNATRQVTHSPVVVRLPLASGCLPEPPGLNEVFPSVAGRATRESAQTPVLELSHERATTTPSQINSTKTRSTLEDLETQRNSTRRRESAIRSQLQSITAPVRRDSESSESEGITEDQSIVADDEDIDADTVDGTPRTSARFGRRQTFIQDHSYFESAMHHLGIEEAAESVSEARESGEHEFWSQYGAMD